MEFEKIMDHYVLQTFITMTVTPMFTMVFCNSLQILCHGLWFFVKISVTVYGEGGSKFLPLYFNTLFQFVFHKILLKD